MIKRILISLLLVTCCIASTSLSAQAGSNILQPGSDCGDSNGEGSSAVCTDVQNANPTTDPLVDRLEKIAQIVAYVAGGGAILMILVGSVQYVTSAGDSNKIGSAKNTIIYALIGLIVIVLATSIIEFVVNKL